MQFDFDAYGSAFLATRLHKLRVLISDQCEDLFADHNIIIPSSCVSISLVLGQIGPTSITKIASATTYSHQLVSQHLVKMENLDLIERQSDPRDNRRLLISLTPKGKEEVQKLDEALRKLAKLFDNLFVELDCDLKNTLIKATYSLNKVPLNRR